MAMRMVQKSNGAFGAASHFACLAIASLVKPQTRPAGKVHGLADSDTHDPGLRLMSFLNIMPDP